MTMSNYDNPLLTRLNKLAVLSDTQYLLQLPNADLDESTDTKTFRLSINNEAKDLTRQIQVAEDELQKLRDHRASLAAPTQATITKAHTKAYTASQSSLPYLPSFTNPLTILLAYRQTLCSISTTRSLITSTQDSIETQQSHFSRQQSALELAQSINTELKRVISELQASNTPQSREEIEKTKLKEMDDEIRRCRKGRQGLLRGFGDFVEESLGKMIAVEELGGPVVGNLLEAASLDGFLDLSSGGKRKKRDRVKGQRLITDIWGPAQDVVMNEGGEVDVVEAAGREMVKLVEDLLNAALEDVGSTKWLELERDTGGLAAARFLVRCHVAGLKVGDAGKMRLVDFGGRVEDG